MYMGNIKGVAGNARWRGGTQACTPETLFNLFRKIHFQLFFEKLRHE